MNYVFGKTKVDKHICSFDSVKLVKVIADNPRYSVADKGAWSLLTRYCSCGAERAFDLMRREDAEERLEQLIRG